MRRIPQNIVFTAGATEELETILNDVFTVFLEDALICAELNNRDTLMHSHVRMGDTPICSLPR